MADNKITIKLQGPEGEEDLLHFNHFLDLLNTIKDGLNHLERLITNKQETYVKYRITNLNHSSPFAIELTPIAKEKKYDNVSESVVSTFIDSVSAIEENKKVPEYFDFQMLDIIKKIGNKRNKYFSDITINNGNTGVEISPKLAKHADEIIGEDRKTHGSIVGMLEAINIHNEANKFSIYPSIGPSKVECSFQPSLLNKAIKGMAHRVKVEGKLKYRGLERFPYKVFINKLEIYPPEDELPTLSDLRGIAPNMTGDKSTIEFINDIREDDE